MGSSSWASKINFRLQEVSLYIGFGGVDVSGLFDEVLDFSIDVGERKKDE